MTTVFAATVFVLLAALGYSFATRVTTQVVKKVTPVYNPLGDYPTQTITSPQPIPLAVGQVGVDAIKCNNTQHEVPVYGKTIWVLVTNPAVSALGAEGQGTRMPGCVHPHFDNPFPLAVIAEANRQAAQGTHITTWVIRGIETPVAPRGERSVAKAYRTDNFRILA